MEMRTDDMPFVTSHLEFDAMGAHEGVAPKGAIRARQLPVKQKSYAITNKINYHYHCQAAQK